MKIALTLDYELFLGNYTGTIDNCLIIPMNKLQEAVEKHNVKYTIFVDATYLYRLSQLRENNSEIDDQYSRLINHIVQLRDYGHDIQLHIHPHWPWSSYRNGEWTLDHTHYKLCDLSHDEAKQVVKDSKDLLDGILGYKTTIFRAGGFSAQPTELLRTIFDENGIIADSSVCPGTKYNSPQQLYDYTTAPRYKFYSFSDDITKIDNSGRYVEFPISMYNVSPLFHWKLAWNRLFISSTNKTFGDGVAVKATNDSIIQRLTSYHDCPVSIDGYKANLLKNGYKKAIRNNQSLLTVLGHPKLATPHSVSVVKSFVSAAVAAGDEFVTLTNMISNE